VNVVCARAYILQIALQQKVYFLSDANGNEVKLGARGFQLSLHNRTNILFRQAYYDTLHNPNVPLKRALNTGMVFNRRDSMYASNYMASVDGVDEHTDDEAMATTVALRRKKMLTGAMRHYVAYRKVRLRV